MTLLGIDPGQKGALVALDGLAVRHVSLMSSSPKVGVDMVAVRDVLEALRPDRAVIERAQAMPGNSSSRSANYMRDYGAILGLLCALRIPYETVHPRTWHSQLVGKREGDPKARALEVVRQRLPTLELIPPRCRTVHDGIVDAACIALWGQRR